MKIVYHLGMIAALLTGLLISATPAYAAAVIIVDSTEDTLTNNGNCDLREALQAADMDSPVDACAAGSGTDTITFNITGAGVQTITLSGYLAVNMPVLIDGTSQPGYSGTPLIRLDGDGGSNQQFLIAPGADGSSLKGLMFTNATWNAVVIDPGVTGITITASYLNTDGTSQIPSGSTATGVLIFKADGNTIGGSTAADRNLFSGNTGVQIDGGSNNLVQGNYFGVRADGLTPITNQTFNTGAIFVEVNGGLIPANNVIRHNVMTGFYSGVDLEAQVNHTTIAGNYIGVGVDGSTPLPLGNGIVLSGADHNTIGGSTLADRNVISGNIDDNIEINNANPYHSDNNLIFGNYIGIDAAGLNAVAASGKGIHLYSGDSNQIGDAVSGVGNVIAGNVDQIYSEGATNTLVQNNKLGVNRNGAPIGTPQSGAVLSTSSSARFLSNWIANDSNYSILIDSTSSITGTSTNNCFVNNGSFGLTSTNAVTSDFTGNWWGNASGPTDGGNPGGTGDIANPTSGNINYSGFLTSAPSVCAPVVSLDVPSLSFGNQLVGTSSAVMTATLTNTGSKPLNFTAIATTAPYSLDGTGTCPTGSGTLAPAASCTIKVRFSPTVAGLAVGSVSITSDASTSPNTLPLSGTGVAGTQLLKNASFEKDVNQDKKPDNWILGGFKSATDGRLCTVHKAGACSLRFAGDKTKKTATQTLLKSGVAGDDFAFSLWSTASGVPPTATYQLTVTFYNGVAVVGTQNLTFTKGSHPFKKVTGVFTAPAAYTKIVYRITFKAASGTASFDSASLTWAP